MFDLEQAIAKWREQIGVSDAEVLDELESHLRDEFESQLRSESDAHQAFEMAMKRIGRPDALRDEFAKSFTLFHNLKNAFLTVAGIPTHNLATTMNTTRVEPAWATYLKATAFLLPAILLAVVSAIFVVPKLQQICRDAGLPEATAGTFWSLVYSSIQLMFTLSQYGFIIFVTIVALLILLECRFTQWPRYRRAAVGCGAFVLNSLVLFALFMMFLAAIVAAPALAHAK